MASAEITQRKTRGKVNPPKKKKKKKRKSERKVDITSVAKIKCMGKYTRAKKLRLRLIFI